MVARNVADVSFLIAAMEGSFDRVSRGVAVRCAIRQSRGGARVHDGNSGQSGGYQELHTKWIMRRADELSIVHDCAFLFFSSLSGFSNSCPSVSPYVIRT